MLWEACARRAEEILARGRRHAEQDIVAWAQANAARVIAVGVGRPHCPTCVDAIEGAGGLTASPRRQP